MCVPGGGAPSPPGLDPGGAAPPGFEPARGRGAGNGAVEEAVVWQDST